MTTSKKKIFFLFFSLCLGFSSFFVRINHLAVEYPLLAYTDHPTTITINGNSDFQNQAIANSWPGDGSEDTPYSITNLNITNSTTSEALLSISDTNVYFNVTDSLFDGGFDGILFHNVTNGLIQNNIVINSLDTGVKFEISVEVNLIDNNIQLHSNGIYLFNTIETIIFNNTIWNNDNRGILVDYSEDLMIWNNSIYENGREGITFRDSEESTIKDNYIYENGQNVDSSGIQLGNSDFINVTGNSIYGNYYNGLECGESDNMVIQGNAIYENEQNGLVISSNSDVFENTLYKNVFWGLRAIGSGSNISQNNFIDNNIQIDPTSQAADFTGNNFSHNFWSSWIVPDVNEDGIVDVPYECNEIFDYYPLTDVTLNPRLHVLTKPVLIFPNNEYYVNGIVNITWGRASDTFGQEIRYSVSYSVNIGSSWILIQDSLDDPSYLWDSSTLNTNQISLIRIDAQCTSGLTSFDISDDTFAIANVEHTLSLPNFIRPLSGDSVCCNVEVEWEKSVDSWYLPVTYELYFLGTNDEWVLIDVNIENETYTWNTTSSVDDGETVLMVVARSFEDVTVNATTGVIIIDNNPGSEPKSKIPGYSTLLTIGISFFAILSLGILLKKKT